MMREVGKRIPFQHFQHNLRIWQSRTQQSISIWTGKKLIASDKMAEKQIPKTSATSSESMLRQETGQQAQKLYTGTEIIKLYKEGRRDFTGINAKGANLIDANLTGANLTGAGLIGANLTRANLTGAIGLGSARLRPVILFNTRADPENRKILLAARREDEKELFSD